MISNFLNFLKDNKLYLLYNSLRYQAIVKRLKEKNKINVIFFINHISQWKYQSLFNIYKTKKRYSVKVIYLPVDNLDSAYLKDYIFNKKEFKKIGINLISSYNLKTKLWKKINELFSPDIIFFSRSLTKSKFRYQIFDFKKSLNIYVPYSLFTDNNDKLQCATLFHKLLWKQFLPYKVNHTIAKQFYNAKNIVITDYLGCDVFKLERNNNNYWKNKKHKKIIWAPHHTIDNSFKNNYFSTFIFFHNHMKNLAKKYNGSIDFCFKPHPILKDKLYDHQEWGVKKTNEYYKFWNNGNNTILSESGYQDLFIQSDALILDSVSFMAEYLYLDKPYCFLTKKNYSYDSSLNAIGKSIFSVINKSNNVKSLEFFINNSVIKERDPKKKNRSSVLKKLNHLNKDNLLASENIFNHINSKI